MIEMLWGIYLLFAWVAAIYIFITVLWVTKPVGFENIVQELKIWLSSKLYLDRYKIYVEQVIWTAILILPLFLAGVFYVLISFVITKQN